MSDKKNSKNWFLRHKVLSVIGVLVILGIIGTAANGENSTTTNSNDGSSASGNSAKTAKLNEAATDGKFEFTVASVECGKSSVGNQYLNKTAQGQFCLLNVTVKNVGDQSQLFDSSNVSLYDSEGAKFSADGVASSYANTDANTFLNQINPGNSVTAVVVFDVPKGKTPITAELHDSPFSSGVKVNLQ